MNRVLTLSNLIPRFLTTSYFIYSRLFVARIAIFGGVGSRCRHMIITSSMAIPADSAFYGGASGGIGGFGDCSCKRVPFNV